MLNYVPRWWPSWIGNKIIYWGNKIICCGNKIIDWGNNIGNCKSNYHIISISTALCINGQNYEHYVNGTNYEYIILSISKTLITSKSSVFDRMILASKNRVRTCKIWGGGTDWCTNAGDGGHDKGEIRYSCISLNCHYTYTKFIGTNDRHKIRSKGKGWKSK